VVGGLAGVAAGLALPGTAALAARPPARNLSFHHLHTGESLTACYWEKGHYVPDALAAIDHVLRDHRTGEVKPIDRDLLDLLVALRRSVDSHARFEVICGYRSPATNEALRQHTSGVAKKSLHMSARAIDIRLPGQRLKDLRAAALALKRGGVGYYPKSDFIHVDTGRVRWW
jgi:uncharacterized protein YcbK (DUF882 family)